MTMIDVIMTEYTVVSGEITNSGEWFLKMVLGSLILFIAGSIVKIIRENIEANKFNTRIWQ